VIAEAARLAAVNGLLAIFGAGILAIVGRPRAESIVVQAAVSLLTGLAGFFVVMPPLLYAGFSPTVPVLVILAVLAAGAGLYRRRRAPSGMSTSAGSGLLALAVALPAGLLALQAADKRPIELDWQLDWALKARLLAGNGGRLMGALDPRFLSSRLYQGSHPEYPLGLPALQALDYHAMGRLDSDVVHVQYVIALAAFVITVWALLRPHANPLLLTGGAVAVMASPAVQARVLADPWDVMTASFWVAGALLAGLWYRDGDRTTLALAVLFLTAALETKLEAIANTLILFALIALALALRRQWPRLRDGAVAAAATALLVAPWQIYSRAHGLHSRVIQPSLTRMGRQLGDLPTIVHSLSGRMLASAWEAAVPLCVGAAVVMLVRGRSRPLAAGFLILLAALDLGLVFVYWNHVNALHRLLNTSASRTISTEELLSLVMLPLLLDRALGDVSLGSLATRLRRRVPAAATAHLPRRLPG